jgi:hypothetical protein
MYFFIVNNLILICESVVLFFNYYLKLFWY